MDLFVQSTLVLIQWVSGVCIFMLFYIWFFKKYLNPKCHIFTIYYAVLGFGFISEIIKNIFPPFQYTIRFINYFVMEPLSILVLAFFISVLVLNRPVHKAYILSIIILLVINMIPHLPYKGFALFNPQYSNFEYSIIGSFILIVLSMFKMIRDVGRLGNLTVPKGLWGFLAIAYVHKAALLTFSGVGLYTEDISTYSAFLMLMMIFSFLMLLKVFYETISKGQEFLNASISKSELLAKEEDELVQYIYQMHPEIVNKFADYGISDRELAIIILTLFGISMKDCAEYFNVSVKTVEQYRYRLKKKIGLEGSLAQSLNVLRYKLG